jgi:hypothetical protein
MITGALWDPMPTGSRLDADHPLSGVRPWGRTGSGGCFDRLPGVVVLELGGAQIAKG